MNYDEETKKYYQNDSKASEYHYWFTQASGLNGWRFRYIANRERAAVKALLMLVPHGRVIDIPAGTGKMAEVFGALGSKVLVCDVSENMLKIASAVYAEHQVETDVKVVDLQNATAEISGVHDAVVCVRLMHRVPASVRMQMLEEISKLAPFSVVSFAVMSPYQRIRGRLRRALMSKGSDEIDMHRQVLKTWPDKQMLARELSMNFLIESARPVSNWLSSEVMYLLRSRHFN